MTYKADDKVMVSIAGDETIVTLISRAESKGRNAWLVLSNDGTRMFVYNEEIVRLADVPNEFQQAVARTERAYRALVVARDSLDYAYAEFKQRPTKENRAELHRQEDAVRDAWGTWENARIYKEYLE